MLLTAARLFTAASPRLLHNHVLEIDGRGRIASIRAREKIDGSAELVDFGEATLLPGLIDIHQHLCFDATLDPVAQLQADDDEALLQRMRHASQRALAVGITTVRDLGDRDYLSLAARGVDVIKIMASGGNMTPTVGPHESQFTRGDIATALREAHDAGLHLAAHAHGVDAVRDAVAVGVDSIEHCTLFTVDGVAEEPALLEQLARSSCVVSMTAAVIPGSEAPFAAIRQRMDAILNNHKHLYRNGARVVCSSDAGVVPSKPHDVLPHGVVDFLPMLGMSPAEAITNVTATAAAACGIADRTGTLEVGKDADVVAVAGDPLTNLSALHDVLAVYVRGTRV